MKTQTIELQPEIPKIKVPPHPVWPDLGREEKDALKQRIREVIRVGATPRHVPAKIIAVDDIPRTKSGKIVELAVRSVVHGEAVENTEALANPEALQHFASIEELTES